MSNAIVPADQRFKILRGTFDRSKASIAKALPKHFDAERLLRIALAAASRNPRLLECTPQSILMATIQAGMLGLEPETPLGLAYLVPYQNRSKNCYEAQFIPGYRGLVKLAHQSGVVSQVRSRVVYSGDVFDVEYGITEKLKHTPSFDDSTERKVVAVYAVAEFKDGPPQFEVMTFSQIESIRARSKSGSSGPWVTDWVEMGRKTVLRRLCKSLPLTTELAGALDAQARAEGGDAPDYGELVTVFAEDDGDRQLGDGTGSQTASASLKATLATNAGKVAAEAAAQG